MLLLSAELLFCLATKAAVPAEASSCVLLGAAVAADRDPADRRTPGCRSNAPRRPEVVEMAGASYDENWSRAHCRETRFLRGWYDVHRIDAVEAVGHCRIEFFEGERDSSH